MKRFLAISLGALLLSACGDSDTTAEVTGEFRAGYIEECVTAAESSAGSNELFEPVCTCAADKLIAETGPNITNTSEARAQELLIECAAENGLNIPN